MVNAREQGFVWPDVAPGAPQGFVGPGVAPSDPQETKYHSRKTLFLR